MHKQSGSEDAGIVRDSRCVPAARASWRLEIGESIFGSSVASSSRWRDEGQREGHCTALSNVYGVSIEAVSLNNARSRLRAATRWDSSLSHLGLAGTFVVSRFQRSQVLCNNAGFDETSAPKSQSPAIYAHHNGNLSSTFPTPGLVCMP